MESAGATANESASNEIREENEIKIKFHASPSHRNNGMPPPSTSSSPRLGILGIGLVMEEVGKGARLVFRYPAAPPPYFLDQSDNSGLISQGKPNNLPGEANHSSKDKTGSEQLLNRGTVHNSPVSKRKGLSTNNDSSDSSLADNNSIDLFFDLPSRVISKLFRPKRPLCGQPLTLNISGTTFCCRAELFDSHPSTIIGASAEGSPVQSHPLVLFSVIVAMAPLAPSSNHSRSSQSNNYNSTTIHDVTYHSQFPCKRVDTAFTTIRRVHRNLARICRVLTREEVRCRYVSLQCSMLLQIRKDYESRAGPDRGFNSHGGGSAGVGGSSVVVKGSNSKGNNDGAGAGGGSGTAAGGLAGSDSKDGINSRRVSSGSHVSVGNVTVSSNGQPPMSPKEKRGSASSNPTDAKSKPVTSGASPSDESDGMALGGKTTRSQRREYVQNLIEVLLAASPGNAKSGASTEEEMELQRHSGNLARELAFMFHSLAKYDDPAAPSNAPAFLSRISGREGVVYINRHIAIPLETEAASSSPSNGSNQISSDGCVRPYHTLLFPNSSPSEILKSLVDDSGNFGSSYSGNPSAAGGEINTTSAAVSTNDKASSSSLAQTIRRILTQLHPRKSLYDVAWDASLPLFQVMDAATWLVRSRMCVVIMPVLRKNRYACADGVVGKMKKMALPFWQAFGMRSRNCRFHWGSGTGNVGNVPTANGGRTEAPHIFVVVSSLTTMRDEVSSPGEEVEDNLDDKSKTNTASSPTLGEAIDALCGINEVEIDDSKSQIDDDFFRAGKSSLGTNQLMRPLRRASTGPLNASSSRGVVPGNNPGRAYRRIESGTKDPSTRHVSSEDMAYSMAVWLLAQNVIIELRDYLVATGTLKTEQEKIESINAADHLSPCGESAPNFKSSQSTSSSSEELLFHELMEADCLDGNKSIPAICYRFGIDRLRMDRFKSWGQRRKLLEIVSRMAYPTDDWGVP